MPMANKRHNRGFTLWLDGVSIRGLPTGQIKFLLLPGEPMSDFYNMAMDDIHGTPTALNKFADTACLVVNVASR